MKTITYKMRWIQFSVTLVFLCFSVLMIIVTVYAYSRRSGNTGLDMSKMQQLRYDAVYITEANVETEVEGE